jgi:aspartyl-tRNA(Asn)/glutamyl-tRNA(Gln) amidotransferase subunit C
MAHMPSITRADVAHLARLSRLALSDDELDQMAGQLEVIINSVARVSEVADADVPPTSHSVPLTNVFRPDELAGAPATEDQRFRVPRILDEE